jgi:hypothetical protein
MRAAMSRIRAGQGSAGGADVLDLEAVDGRVAGEPGPGAGAGVVRSAGGDDVDGAGAVEEQVAERAREISAAIDAHAERRRDPGAGPGGVVPDEPSRGERARAAGLPAGDLDDVEAGVAHPVGEAEVAAHERSSAHSERRSSIAAGSVGSTSA